VFVPLQVKVTTRDIESRSSTAVNAQSYKVVSACRLIMADWSSLLLRWNSDEQWLLDDPISAEKRAQTLLAEEETCRGSPTPEPIQ
jgi:hypothetical protein